MVDRLSLIRLERADSLATTGNQLWPAALTLQRSLSGAAGVSRVLELGAGLGWLAIAVAMTSADTSVCATDQAAQLPLLRHNVALNAALHGERVAVQLCDFFDESSATALAASRHGWSHVLASDVVYTLDLADAFAATVARLLDRDEAVMWYCHTFGRYCDVDERLLAQLAARGLSVRERVLDADVPFAPPCGEFEIFAEQVSRILIVQRVPRAPQH